MMEERNIRPWRKVARNFSEKPANMIEKLWLVKEMVLHGETAKDPSKLYGIGRKALKKWSKAYNDRGILHGNSGVGMDSICREYNIVVGKPPASTTSISQPLDVGKAFVAAKTINRGV